MTIISLSCLCGDNLYVQPDAYLGVINNSYCKYLCNKCRCLSIFDFSPPVPIAVLQSRRLGMHIRGVKDSADRLPDLRHDADCKFYSLAQICTCGLLHDLSWLADDIKCHLYPEFREEYYANHSTNLLRLEAENMDRELAKPDHKRVV